METIARDRGGVRGEFVGALRDPDENAVRDRQVHGVEPGVQRADRRRGRRVQAREESGALRCRLRGTGGVRRGSRGVPAILEAREQLSDRGCAQPELRLVSEEGVQVARRLRTADHQDPQRDVLLPADPGRLERAL
jgi:hypothetical protein